MRKLLLSIPAQTAPAVARLCRAGHALKPHPGSFARSQHCVQLADDGVLFARTTYTVFFILLQTAPTLLLPQQKGDATKRRGVV